MYKTANILVTGGAGCLGRAIARKRKEEGWTGKLTVYSRDTFKHERMHNMYPDVNFIQGDILTPELLYNAMVGHDIVIHAAACKVIPTSEKQSLDTIYQNIEGSINVCTQAVRAGIKHVLGISTDKACHPANAYGATKMLMEKSFQEFARMPVDTEFHLIRYGNVLESTGSVVEAWKRAASNGEPVRVTDPEMTRFYISPRQAANYAIHALEFESGLIYVPVMAALSLGDLLQYVVGDKYPNIVRIPLREGEKIHETLVTIDERRKTKFLDEGDNDAFLIHPTTSDFITSDAEFLQGIVPFTSDSARKLTEAELNKLLAD